MHLPNIMDPYDPLLLKVCCPLPGRVIFNTRILANLLGMCPPCPLQQFYQMAPENQPTHFMRGTAAEIWGTDTHEVMYTTAIDWDTDDLTTTAADYWDFDE